MTAAGSTLLTGIGELVTNDPAYGDGSALGLVRDAAVVVQDGAVLHTTPLLPTTVGNDVVIGHLAHLECCTVHDGALIGTGSIVLHRAVVEAGALVGAGLSVGLGAILGTLSQVRPMGTTRRDVQAHPAQHLDAGKNKRTQDQESQKADHGPHVAPPHLKAVHGVAALRDDLHVVPVVDHAFDVVPRAISIAVSSSSDALAAGLNRSTALP